MDAPHRNSRWLSFQQFPRHLIRFPNQSQIGGQRVGCTQRKHAQGNLGTHKRLHYFVNRAVSAASHDRVVTLAYGPLCQGRRASRPACFKCVRFNTRFAEGPLQLAENRMSFRGVLT